MEGASLPGWALVLTPTLLPVLNRDGPWEEHLESGEGGCLTRTFSRLRPMRRGMRNAQQQGLGALSEQTVPPSRARRLKVSRGAQPLGLWGETVRRVECLSRAPLHLESGPWLPRGPASSPAWFLGMQWPGPMALHRVRISQLLKPGSYDKNEPDGLFSFQTKMQEQ